MRRSSRVILLLGIFLAIGAFMLILFLGGGGRPQATPTPAIAHIVKAVVDIPQGTSITESMITVADVNLADAPGDAFALAASVVGKTARQSITAGAYVPTAAITGAAGAEVDIAQELKAGERAVALRFEDPNKAVAFLIQSGDRVDVVVTLQNLPVGFTFNLDGGKKTVPDIPLPNGDPPAQGPAGDTGFQLIPADKINSSTAKLLIQNVRVVYVRSEVVVAAGAEGTPAPGSQTPTAQTVVLALNAQQAELLSYVQMQITAVNATASVYLAIRSPDDAAAAEDQTSGIVLRSLIDDYGVLPPRLIIVDDQGR